LWIVKSKSVLHLLAIQPGEIDSILQRLHDIFEIGGDHVFVDDDLQFRFLDVFGLRQDRQEDFANGSTDGVETRIAVEDILDSGGVEFFRLTDVHAVLYGIEFRFPDCLNFLEFLLQHLLLEQLLFAFLFSLDLLEVVVADGFVLIGALVGRTHDGVECVGDHVVYGFMQCGLEFVLLQNAHTQFHVGLVSHDYRRNIPELSNLLKL